MYVKFLKNGMLPDEKSRRFIFQVFAPSARLFEAKFPYYFPERS